VGITKVSAVGFLALAIATVQTATWEQLIASGTESHVKGRYAQAEAAVRPAFSRASRGEINAGDISALVC
jgi:hypothetical protein